MKECHVEREIGGRMMRMETGVVAKLANACVMITHGDSTVMCSAVRANPRPGLDFFPLQCDYRERTSAAGKFPGGFRKREGAPNEKEVLTMRMIDRPIRPLFPDGFIDEVQLQCWVMSHDGQNDTDVLACTGASASLPVTAFGKNKLSPRLRANGCCSSWYMVRGPESARPAPAASDGRR